MLIIIIFVPYLEVFFFCYLFILALHYKKKREVTPYAHSPIFTNTKHIDTISLEKKKKMTLKLSLFAYN